MRNHNRATAYLLSLFLVGCAVPSANVEEEPPSINWVLPTELIEVSLNTQGKLSIRPRLEKEIELFDTPLGSLTLKAGRKSFSTSLVNSLEKQNPGKRLLIIRIDDHVDYYEIEKNKKLDLTFEMDDRLFKRVRVQNNTVKGDETITISLESVSTASGETEPDSDDLSTNQELKKIEEALLNSGVLITGPTTEFEGEVSEVTARESSDSVYAMIRWSDGAASSLVFYANKDVLAREEEVEYETDFEGSWSWNSNDRLQVDMDEGSKYVFSNTTSDEIETAPDKLLTNQELKKIEEALFNSGVLITGPTTEFEGEVSEVTARESSNSVYA